MKYLLVFIMLFFISCADQYEIQEQTIEELNESCSSGYTWNTDYDQCVVDLCDKFPESKCKEGCVYKDEFIYCKMI